VNALHGCNSERIERYDFTSPYLHLYDADATQKELKVT